MKNKDQNKAVNVLKKLVAAVKNGSRDLNEFVLDAQGTNVFEQQIEQAKTKLDHAKSELTEVMAKHKQAIRVCDIITDKISSQEQAVSEALTQENDSLALTLATSIVELEKDLVAQHVIVETFSEHVEELKLHVEQSERTLKDYERQLNIVKTTEKIQQATAAIKDNLAMEDKQLSSAKKSLKRIRQKQQEQVVPKDASDQQAQLNVQPLSDQDQANKVKQVLERLKQKKKN